MLYLTKTYLVKGGLLSIIRPTLVGNPIKWILKGYLA
jgi:hypothetical protein